MAKTKVRVVLAEAVVVGPDDVLIIHVAEDDLPQDTDEQLKWIDQWEDEIERFGLKERALVLLGDLTIGKVSKVVTKE